MYDFAATDPDAPAASGGSSHGTPHLLLTAAEPLRLPVELGSSLVGDLLWPPAPEGQGRPVLVLPGFYASDALTARLRGHLRKRGYDVHGWGLGRNLGLTDHLVDGLLQRFDEVRTAAGQPVAVVGWSFGGLLARWLSFQRPGQVRQVICLGSPWRAEGERTRATRMFEQAAVRHGLSERARDIVDELRGPLDVHCTAVWSRTDGVTSWRGCRLDEGPLTEDVAVPSSHIGLVSNPLALAVVDDRLAQDLDDWQPFDWSRALGRRVVGPLGRLGRLNRGAA